MEGVNQYPPRIPSLGLATHPLPTQPTDTHTDTGPATEQEDPATRIDEPLAIEAAPGERGDGADAARPDAGERAPMLADEGGPELQARLNTAEEYARFRVQTHNNSEAGRSEASRSEGSFHTAREEWEGSPRGRDHGAFQANTQERGVNTEAPGGGGAVHTTLNLNFAPLFFYQGPLNPNHSRVNVVNNPVIMTGGAEPPWRPGAPHEQAAPHRQAGPADEPRERDDLRIPLLGRGPGQAPAQDHQAADLLVMPQQRRVWPPGYLYPGWMVGVTIFSGSTWMQLVPLVRRLGEVGATLSYPLLPVGAIIESWAICRILASKQEKEDALAAQRRQLEAHASAYATADAVWKSRHLPGGNAQARPPDEQLADAALKFEALSTHARYGHMTDKAFRTLVQRDVGLQAFAAALKGFNYVTQTLTAAKPLASPGLNSATGVVSLFAGLLHCHQAYLERQHAQRTARTQLAVQEQIQSASRPESASRDAQLLALDQAYRTKRYGDTRGASAVFSALVGARSEWLEDESQALETLMDAVRTTMLKTTDEALLAANGLQVHSTRRMIYGVSTSILALASAALAFGDQDDPTLAATSTAVTATFATSAVVWLGYCAHLVRKGVQAKASALSEVPSADDVAQIRGWLADPVASLERNFVDNAAHSRFFVSTLLVRYLSLGHKDAVRDAVLNVHNAQVGNVLRTKFAIRLLSVLVGKTPQAIRALRIQARSMDPAMQVRAVADVARSLVGQASVEQRVVHSPLKAG
ncbi:chromosomal replication initiator protein DnaA [Pandoraea sputorum]|uniref:Uncharacterized protein n=1 Tax=Pandoraea sputorum TaxID=93222 RepID=A0A5E5BGJ6_9BURK|nr:hypothetical protein [Pandoraea sputorum]VVE84397.1 hypothetical protein PSP31121_04742 [Pandoraea sputorum]